MGIRKHQSEMIVSFSFPRKFKISLLKSMFSVRKCFLLLSIITLVWLFRFLIFEKDLIKHERNNYFKNATRLQTMDLLINTSHCKIPNFDPWDKDALPFIKTSTQQEKCSQTHYNWSFIRDNQYLIINKKQIELDGYSFYKGFCCYKVIKRVKLMQTEQKLQDKITDADNLIQYSSSCIDINFAQTRLKHEFIMVECGYMKLIPVYRSWHGTGVVVSGSRVEAKIKYWKQKTQQIPPNVVIIGLDSTSRLNVERNMPQMKDILQKLKAVGMLGYTKVGSNTFPNIVAMLTGYTEGELKRICNFSNKTPQDDCPYIWKLFDSSVYITAHSEDEPFFAIFNYLKAGFVTQPVDFYLRPLFYSVYENGRPPFFKKPDIHTKISCIGPQTSDEVILSYVESILDLGHKHKTPIFSISWSTHGTHNNPNYLQDIDTGYTQFISRLEKKGILNNSIIIFMGDHGYRYGPFRETLLGYYEDKLPNMWILLPPWIRKKFPEWQNALEINSKRLTSPFNLYWTLNEILNQFSARQNYPEDSKNRKTGAKILRKYINQSFFQPVPENNTCADIGIPREYCACHIPHEIGLNDQILLEAAKIALAAKNNELPSVCAVLSVNAITTGTTTFWNQGKQSNFSIMERFVIGFNSEPGNFAFEAQIDYEPAKKIFNKNEVSLQRTNKINPAHILCINDAKMELFCFCR